GLSGIEKKRIYNNIVSLSQNQTILIVDHHKNFLSVAKKVFALGNGGGKNSGNIINTADYLKSQDIIFLKPITNVSEEKYIVINNDVYSYKGVNIKIVMNSLNIIIGKSGIGKSTLLREYLKQFFENYQYVSQKNLLGNKNSCVATLLNINNKIFEMFSDKFGKDKKFFSNLTGSKNVCRHCSGAGYIEIGAEYSNSVKICCNECRGTGFGIVLQKYKIGAKSIFDIWGMTIDEFILYCQEYNVKLINILLQAQSLLLGHLCIGQSSVTLSGGENIRIKVLKSANSSAEIIGIDEPFRGLNSTEISVLLSFFRDISKNNKTIIVADHEEDSFVSFDKVISLENIDDFLVEKCIK
ncbi:MAG: ATP-binding cassette domain-containing protein, partial [Oscillospiraceae bacterium]|nr:ATP-binding cassette domain-containing protein [Oscillospiraceae bacterium]